MGTDKNIKLHIVTDIKSSLSQLQQQVVIMYTTQDLNGLKCDLEEYERVLATVNRPNVRASIADSISTLKTNIKQITQEIANNTKETTKAEEKPPTTTATTTTTTTTTKQNLFTAKISNYGRDESAKLMKVYITLPNIEKLTQEQVSCDFTEHSFRVFVSNHNGKNYLLEILKLAGTIEVAGSSCRVKSGNVIVSLKKGESKLWGCLTDAEKRTKEKKDNEMDSKKDGMDSSDPSAGIMNLMKKMYDDGDDDMKRMIKKTWYESQQKQKSGEMPGMPDMPGMPNMPGMPGMPLPSVRYSIVVRRCENNACIESSDYLCRG